MLLNGFLINLLKRLMMKKNNGEIRLVVLFVFIFIVILIGVYSRQSEDLSSNDLSKRNDYSSNSSNYYSSNPYYDSSKRPMRNNGKYVDDETGFGAVMVFFAAIMIVWMLIYSLQGEFRDKPKKTKEKSHMKAIVILQSIALSLCIVLTVYEPFFVWGIIISIFLLFISLCYWLQDDGYVQYGKYISLEKTKIKINVKQKYRIQIFLNGSCNNTAWGGDDMNVVINRAKDILENNSWDISKVIVRRGNWKGEVIKEFSKKPILKKKKNPIVSKKKYCNYQRSVAPYQLDSKPVLAQDLVTAARQYGYKGKFAAAAGRILRENGREVVYLWMKMTT